MITYVLDLTISVLAKIVEAIRSPYDAVASNHLKAKVSYEYFMLRRLVTRVQTDQSVTLGPIRIKTGPIHKAIELQLNIEDDPCVPVVENLLREMLPLILLLSYKILDSTAEWIIQENIRLGIAKEIPKLHKERPPLLLKCQMPETFAESIVGNFFILLYQKLMPFRHAIVHRSSFFVDHTGLTIKDSNAQPSEWHMTPLAAQALLSAIDAFLLTALEGNLPDSRLLDLKAHLDVLAPLHCCARFGGKPIVKTFLEYPTELNSDGLLDIDLKLYRQAKQCSPEKQIILDLLVILNDPTRPMGWLFPAAFITGGNKLTFRLEDYPEYRDFGR